MTTFIHEILDTWDDGGAGTTDFQGFEIKVTDTSSAATSSPFRAWVDSVMVADIDKTGLLNVPKGYRITESGGNIKFSLQNNLAASVLSSDMKFGWSSGVGNANTAPDAAIERLGPASLKVTDGGAGAGSLTTGNATIGGQLRVESASGNYIVGVAGNTFDFHRGNGVHIGRWSQDKLSLSAQEVNLGGAAVPDSGIGRLAAASLKVTDGSTGLGTLTALKHIVTGGTVTADTPVLDITQTWNNASIIFNGIKANFTDTASNTDSLLIDLQVGGASRFKVDKTGLLNVLKGYRITESGGNIKFSLQNNLGASVLSSDMKFGWSSGVGNANAGPDSGFARLGAASLKVTDGSTGLGALTALRHIVTGGTVTADAPALDITQTWNNAGVTFTGIKANFTNTASAAASALFDLQLGGVSQAKVSRNGRGGFLNYESPDQGDFLFYRSGIISYRIGSQIVQGTKEHRFAKSNTGIHATDYVKLIWDAANTFEINAVDHGTPATVVLKGSNRAAKINDPSGGATQDAEARTAINAIIDTLESHGLSAAV